MTKEKVSEQTTPSLTPIGAPKERETAQGKVLEQTKPPSTTKEVPKEKKAIQNKAPEPSPQSPAKANPPGLYWFCLFLLCISFALPRH